MKALILVFLVIVLFRGTHSSESSDKSECCSSIRLEYEDFETLVYQKYPYLFTDFDMESDSLNGKAHYTSKDGKYAISYNTCQQWVITIVEVHGRGDCSGKIYTSDDHDCPNEVPHLWKYNAYRWRDAGRGANVVCLPGPTFNTTNSTTVYNSDSTTTTTNQPSTMGSSSSTQVTGDTQGLMDTPTFVGQIDNVTAIIGEDIVLKCKVKNLRSRRVAWIHLDANMILAIHHHRITHNARIDTDHEEDPASDTSTWHLKINGVKESDSGCYSCQIDTDPMTKQIGCIDVSSGTMRSPSWPQMKTTPRIPFLRVTTGPRLPIQWHGRPTMRVPFMPFVYTAATTTSVTTMSIKLVDTTTEGAPARECLNPHKCKGHFVDSYKMSRLEECIGACNDNPDCRFYTLEKASGHCILYEDCQDTVDCDTCASGKKYCSRGYQDSKSSTSSTTPASTTGLGWGIFLAFLIVIVAVGLALKFRQKRRNNMEKSARLTDLEQVDFEE